jgi:alpha-mannosidase
MGKFTQALRQIIRQEMREVLTEELLPILQDVLTEQKRPTPSRPKRSKSSKRKTFSKNSILNDLLNDTASSTNFSDMNTGPLVESGLSMMSSEPDVTPMTDIDGRPVDTSNEAVANVLNIMNKDYSALMTAIDKKKGIV